MRRLGTIRHTTLVGLLWRSYRNVAEASNWQNTTLKRYGRLCPGGIQTRNSSKRAAADPRLRLRGHRDLLKRDI